jgi:hypothetical protein
VATVLVTLALTRGTSSAPSIAAAPSSANATSFQRREVIVHFQLNAVGGSGTGCQGTGGYSDIGPGTQVTLKDQSGTILAAGPLGTPTNSYPCTWTAFLEQVPMDRQFYSLEVSHRGQITKSLQELQSTGYAFDVSLGR